MASPGRVNSPELNLRPQLNPAPVVNVAMVRPVNRDGAGSNLMHIADSLSSLSNTVANYGLTSARSGKTSATNSDNSFVKRNQFRSPSDIVAQPDYNPHSEPQQVLVGQATANDIGPKMKDWVMQDWDPEQEPDLYKFLAGRLTELQSTMPPAAQEGFGSTIDTSVRETIKWWDTLQADKNNEAMKTNTFSHFISLNTLYKDLPVDERVKKMKEMGLDQYRTLKFTDGKGSNDLLMNAVDYFAKAGDKDMVRALGNLRRGAKDEIPSLYDMPDYRDRVDKATAEADASWVKLNQAAVGDFEKQVDGIVKTGDLNSLTDLYNGPVGQRLYPDPATRGEKLRADQAKLNKTILDNTVESEKKAALDTHKGTVIRNFDAANGGQNYTDITVTAKDGKTYTWNGQKEAQSNLDEEIKARYEAVAGDPEKTAELDRDIARKASQSSLKVTEWENLFSGALTSAVTNQLLEGKVPPNLKRAYELWSNTKDHPRARKENMGTNGDQTDTFFSLVDTFKTAGYGDDAAYVAANEAQPRFNKALGRVSEELLGQNSSSYDIRSYPQDIQDRITQRASAYMASGALGQSKAVEKAVKDFKEEVVQLDGFGSRPSYVNVPSKSIDKDVFSSSITNFVKSQVTLHGGQQDMPMDVKDVNIFDYGNGRYGLQTGDGEPVEAFFTHRGGAQGRGVMFFTFDDIQRQASVDAAETAAETSRNARNADEKRANANKPLVEGGGTALGSGLSSIGGWLKDNLPRPGQPDKPDPSILKGNTGNPEDAYGATTGDQLRKLTDERLTNVFNLSKEGKLNVSGFVTDRSIAEEFNRRIRASKYSTNQISAAMTRWSVGELEAIKRLQDNNVKPEK